MHLSKYSLFSLVLDNEPYSPTLFKWLWDKHHIAVITYRKFAICIK